MTELTPKQERMLSELRAEVGEATGARPHAALVRRRHVDRMHNLLYLVRRHQNGEAMTLKRVIIAFAIIMLLFGCSDGAVETKVDTEQATVERIAYVLGYPLFRVHDRKEKVVCWMMVGGAIACMPHINEDGR